MFLGTLDFPKAEAVVGTTATVTITPDQDWIIDLTSIALNANDTTAICKTYRRNVGAGNLVGQSQVGYGDVDDTAKFFPAGMSLVAVWTGITTATLATLSVVGLRYQPGTGALVWATRGR